MKFSIRAVCTQGQLISSCSSKRFYNKSFFPQKLFFKKLPFFHNFKFWWHFQIYFFFTTYFPLASEPPKKLSIVVLFQLLDYWLDEIYWTQKLKAGFLLKKKKKKSFPKDLDSEWKSSEFNFLNFLNHLQTFPNILRGQVTCLYIFLIPPSHKS